MCTIYLFLTLISEEMETPSFPLPALTFLPAMPKGIILESISKF